MSKLKDIKWLRQQELDWFLDTTPLSQRHARKLISRLDRVMARYGFSLQAFRDSKGFFLNVAELTAHYQKVVRAYQKFTDGDSQFNVFRAKRQLKRLAKFQGQEFITTAPSSTDKYCSITLMNYLEAPQTVLTAMFGKSDDCTYGFMKP